MLSQQLLLRSLRDPFYPGSEFEKLHSTLQSAWSDRISSASDEVLRRVTASGHTPQASDIGVVLTIYRNHVSGESFKRLLRSGISSAIGGAYQQGKREVNAEAYEQLKSVRKDEFNIQVIDGLSEAGAIAQLSDQIVIAGGEFWDNQLQDSIRDEMKSWFDGELTRDELSGKLKKLINKRLRSDKQDTLGDSYFDRLAHNSIVKTRAVSKFARAKELNAKGYKLINPLDDRTSHICRTLVERGTIYTLEAAQPIVKDLLTARSSEELKATQPFWQSPDESRTPFPPLHWGDCRTIIRIIFI